MSILNNEGHDPNGLFNSVVENAVYCKRTGEGIALKLGGGVCVCRSSADCCVVDLPEKKDK